MRLAGQQMQMPVHATLARQRFYLVLKPGRNRNHKLRLRALTVNQRSRLKKTQS